ncbi:MAG: WbqC family protein [Prevotella sp.]|nr:WbqC family protein [Prevotella sp.]
MEVLLSSTYFGPVQWYQKLHRAETVYIERHESFIKQTYRNRCVIATANGTQALTVPVERGETTLMKDIRISDHGNWRHLHWNALQSAYGESPFFEYYADDLLPFFERRWDFLFDFNLAITETMCELLDIHPNVQLTTQFLPSSLFLHPSSITLHPSSTQDLREAIRPKHPLPDDSFEPRPYYQVFRERHGFLPNLSVLDLLFNMGPEGIYEL